MIVWGFALIGIFVAAIAGIISLIALATIIIGAFSMGGESLSERKERKKALEQVIWNEDARNGDYSEGPIGSNYAISEEPHNSSGNDEVKV